MLNKQLIKLTQGTQPLPITDSKCYYHLFFNMSFVVTESCFGTGDSYMT